ncbi:MAG: AraC family transcriptional regulator [Bacteroidia bacterium]|nr:AraC family transcriptional regulator [Bacteroidia bacterium]
MRIFIKNMVCPRCVSSVEKIFDEINVPIKNIVLGEVEPINELSPIQLAKLDELLTNNGFERIDDKRTRLISAVKTFIIQKIHHQESLLLNMNWSDTLQEHLHYEYNYLSSLFSSVEGITIELYIIKQKVERVKELLVYDELSLGEIADKLAYSSIAHLSAQFKKVTGFTPTVFKKQFPHKRNSIDKL